MKIKAILTGASGMVGEGVLHECLLSNDVEQVLVVGRKHCGITHPKLRELIHNDFFDISSIQSQLVNYNACYFCLGVSSIGMKEEEYIRLTYTLTLNFATLLSRQNAGMTFCYISGAGTDSTGKGKRMWALVKGKTENDILKLPFKKAFMFRPGFMKATEGAKNTLKSYNYFAWLYPVLRTFFPKFTCTLKEVGIAMIRVTLNGYEKNVLEVKDIVAVAEN